MADYDGNLWVAYTNLPEKYNLKGDLPVSDSHFSALEFAATHLAAH